MAQVELVLCNSLRLLFDQNVAVVCEFLRSPYPSSLFIEEKLENIFFGTLHACTPSFVRCCLDTDLIFMFSSTRSVRPPLSTSFLHTYPILFHSNLRISFN